jgi:hypothetical protein
MVAAGIFISKPIERLRTIERIDGAVSLIRQGQNLPFRSEI